MNHLFESNPDVASENCQTDNVTERDFCILSVPRLYYISDNISELRKKGKVIESYIMNFITSSFPGSNRYDTWALGKRKGNKQ